MRQPKIPSEVWIVVVLGGLAIGVYVLLTSLSAS